ncbi:MAG TPA: hypothetical protein VK760_06105 [Candidatus Acidoferrales bacterium]|nr:hypothetical protein [Candidatus Acidoferrales bacterium]
MNWFTIFPDWFTLLLFIAVPAAGVALFHMVLRRFVKPEHLTPHHDVAGFLVAIVGVLYAVVLGFVVVTVWSNFDDVQRTTDVEAGAVADAYAFATLLPDPPRTRVETMLARYALEVRDHEFASLAVGHPDPAARLYLISALQAIAGTPLKPTKDLSEALRNESTRQAVVTGMRDIADNRRLRLIEAKSKLPTPLYLALIIGAFMVLAFVFLFGVENQLLQITMTAIVAGCIGLLLGVIVEFNSPFQGAIRVSPEAWNSLIESYHFDSKDLYSTPSSVK